MKVRDSINKFSGLFFLQGLFQLLHIHTVLFHGNTAEADFIGAESVQRTDKAGLFTDDHIPFIAQGFGEQIHYLLCAGSNENIIKIAADIMGLFHISSHRLPQGHIALCLAILECVDGAFSHNPGGDFRDGLFGECFGSRIAGRQGNHLRVSSIFEYFTDSRGLKCLYSFRKHVFHSETVLSS